MKAILLMFDSLNRHMLPPYGCEWVHAPNFRRLAARAATFDCAYVGSMPCMPARRELHTGRYNFLHRSWGPLEPFDDSMPELLKQAGVYTHLASDHYHYWEEGGCTYHTRYDSWECCRGQEGDPWQADVKAWNRLRGDRPGGMGIHDRVNRLYLDAEEKLPQAQTFAAGLEFLRRNRDADNWFLHLETFDPHEPYFVPQRYKDLYAGFDFTRFDADWPPYAPVPPERQELVPHYRHLNAALISMCDAYLGKVLDAMDEHDLWRDTMLIVNTDHGFLLGEHEWWGKCRMPFYDEIARMPLFAWDPRAGVRGVRRHSLVQTIDIPATLLEFFGRPLPPDMEGRPLRDTIAADAPVREAGLFGVHGGHINVTDGRFVYMRAARGDAPLFEYTHMPTHMRHTFGVDEMRLAQMAPPFRFTKGCPVMKIPVDTARNRWLDSRTFGDLLFDVDADPRQLDPRHDPAAESRLTALMADLMRRNDAPVEQYARMALPVPPPPG